MFIFTHTPLPRHSLSPRRAAHLELLDSTPPPPHTVSVFLHSRQLIGWSSVAESHGAIGAVAPFCVRLVSSTQGYSFVHSFMPLFHIESTSPACSGGRSAADRLLGQQQQQQWVSWFSSLREREFFSEPALTS